MRSFRSFATRWPISSLCVALLLCQMVIAFIPSLASAQTTTTEVAVVDFRNVSAMPEDVYGSMATDAVVVELLRSGKYSVTEADALKAKMDDLGLKAKEDRVTKISLTEPMLQRLGQEVGANAVISGFVRDLKIDEKKKVAQVRLEIRLLDVASREYLNGAVATGTSHERIGAATVKDSDLIVEAIGEAARKAVEQMVTYTIPEATVTGTWGDNEILLNKGSQEGLAKGMEMIAVRRDDTGLDEVVGRIRVTETTDSDARGVVVKAPKGVKWQDRVRAVYDLPKGNGEQSAATTRDKEKRFKSGSALVLALGALVGVFILSGNGGRKGESVGSAVAMAGNSDDIGLRADEPIDAGVLLAWKKPRNLLDANIIEYHVWRDSLGSLNGSTSGGAGVGPSSSIGRMEAVSLNTPVGSFDGSVVEDTVGWQTLPYSLPSADHSSLNTISSTKIPGLILGKHNTYRVDCTYQRQAISGNSSITYWITEPSLAGVATALARPAQVSPGGITSTETADLRDITFTFNGSPGADMYVIEVSPDPTFPRAKTWVNSFYQATPASGSAIEISRTFVNKLSVATEFGTLAPETPLYWRVGARYSGDTPGPYPAGPIPQKDGPKNTRYIYSDRTGNFMFLSSDTVPNPPTGGNNPPTPPGN